MSLVVRGALLLSCLTVAASGADLTLVPVGPTTISPGQTVRIEVFANGVALPKRLRGYQAMLEIVPAGGTTGSLGLVDPTTPDPNNPSIRVDALEPRNPPKPGARSPWDSPRWP